MNCICVKLRPKIVNNDAVYRTVKTYCHIKNIESNAAHILLSTHTLFSCPLQGSYARILDFVQVLYTLGHIDQQIRASGVRSETPDLPGVSNIPTILISEDAGTGLEIIARADGASLNGFR